ncbi:MAG TPA: PTS sugar transporter subunit IIA [Clostridiales bacterium]|nr:PTS sugar transporter subunit IIA [Clostridiales bacterium]
MLRELVEKNRVCFHHSFNNWEDAIRAACQPLLDDGSIEQAYVDSIIATVHKYGPYIVFAPDVAMPHSKQGAEGVNNTAISFMKVEEPVRFLEDNRDKDARLFFTVCAVDQDKHLENMEKLSELLTISPDIIGDLLDAKDAKDLLLIDQKYDNPASKITKDKG